MSLSFEDSLKNNEENAEVANNEMVVEDLESNDMAAAPVMAYSMRSAAVMANALDDDENWERVSNAVPKAAAYDYKYYNGEYNDTNYSTVDEQKNIILDPSQFNITQESYSQYIPFQIPRYYDGFDLAEAKLSIYYVNKNRESSADTPVDVYCNDDYIRFAWLVSDFATRVAGMLQFEIHARGNNSKGESYVWKSKSIDKLNVLQSLEDISVGDIGLSDEEVQGWYNLIREAADSATKASILAQQYAEDAAEAYRLLQDGIADEVQSTINETVAGIVDDAIADQLESYYTKTETYTDDEIDEAIEKAVGAVDERFGTLVDTQNQPLTVEAYVKQEVDNVDVSEQLGAFGTDAKGNATFGKDGEDNDITTVVGYVDYKVSTVDVSKQLGELGTNDDDTPKTVKQYVDEAVDSVDVSDQLGDLGTNDDDTPKTVKQYVDEALDDVSVDLSGYYTKGEVDSLVAPIETNASDISNINTKIAEINQDIANLEASSNISYKATYGDLETDEGVLENMFTLWEVHGAEGEATTEIVKSRFKIEGGGAGTASSTNPVIEYVTPTPYVVTTKDKAIIYYNFTDTDASGNPVPEATAVWYVGQSMGTMKDVVTETIEIGENLYFDATDHLMTGKQLIKVEITDVYGGYTQAVWSVKMVDIRLEDNDVKFDDTRPVIVGNDLELTYVAWGDITEKYVHFILDDKVLDTVQVTTSGDSKKYTITAQEHGAHLLKMYMTATIDKNPISTEPVYRDIIWYDENSTKPVIGTRYQEFTAKQYDTTEIEYTVYDPNTNYPKIEIAVDGEVVSNKTMNKATDSYSFKTDKIGTHIITITCGESEDETVKTTKTLKATIEDLGVQISPVVEGWMFDFNPVGKSNKSEQDKNWTDGSASMSVSDNFDWINGGYQTDENGDQYFCVKAGTTAAIDYPLFGNDARINGKEFKVIFKTTNVKKRDTSFINCMNNGIGLDMKVENANIHLSDKSMHTPYCENDIIEFDFNIYAYDTEKTFEQNIAFGNMPIILTFEDGTPSTPLEYTVDGDITSSFWQSTPQPITIGSEDCDVHIYRMRAYEKSLSDSDVLKNFIADARSAEEMIDRHQRNQIYDTNGNLVSTSASGDFSAEALMKAAPDLRYIFLEVPRFTYKKSDKVDNCNVYFRYPAGTRPEDNWDCTGMRHRGQGTSSDSYGDAGRNIDLCMDRSTSEFKWKDAEGKEVKSKTITLTNTSVPTDYLNIKVNIASSENTNNAELARRFNEYQPFLRYARKKDSKIKDTMEFYNCVVFIREMSTDSATYPHQEFNDTNWHFYAIGNVGDSKKTDDSRVNNASDPKEHVIEIMDVDKPLSSFPTGKEGNAICPVDEWKAGNTAYDILHSLDYEYDEDDLFKSFAGTTYEFRYEKEGINNDEREANINTWRNLYKFIVTSSDAEFYAHLKDYFVVDSALYYYLFTERYTMVDNRCKNSFWHYGKVYISTSEANELGETEASYYIIDDAAAAINEGYRYDLTFGYDFDTALGIDNTGDFVFPYGKEDTDYYVDGNPASGYIFRVADSTFFCRLRDLFPTEMQKSFKDSEAKNAWSSTSLINQWDNSQKQFPEALWLKDYRRKYYRPYTGISDDNSIVKSDKTFLIGKFFGRKKYARRAFENDQEIYFATKYFGNTALKDVFWFRGSVPIGSSIPPNYSLTLVPYSDMYLCVQYGSTSSPIHSTDENGKPKRIKAGESYTFNRDDDKMDFMFVYAASRIQEVDDLSKCYIEDNNFSMATRLQKLVIGSTDDGYENTFMKELLISNNPLLEYLDLRNISGLNSVINVSGCRNLRTLYAEGTNATGVAFADGGNLEIAHLPKVKSLSMKNLSKIKSKDFVMEKADINEDGKFNEYALEALIVENTPAINTYDLVNNSPKLGALRLIGMDWDRSYGIQDSTILDRALNMRGRNNSGGEIPQSVLEGDIYISVINQKQFEDYRKVWSGLNIACGTKIEQVPVYFINDDGKDSELFVYWVEKGQPVGFDPITKDIPTPTKDSTISTVYSFDGWYNTADKKMWDYRNDQIWNATIIKATYTESVREYNIIYALKSTGNTVLKEDLLQQSRGEYGTNQFYNTKICINCKAPHPSDVITCEKCGNDKFSDIPIYDGEEAGFKYYLFKGWDKSGFLLEGKEGTDLIPEVKVITKEGTDIVPDTKLVIAQFDDFQYASPSSFAGKPFDKYKAVEIYALSKLIGNSGKQPSDFGANIKVGNEYSFEMGYDIDYNDIESTEIIVDKICVLEGENHGKSAVFTGSNHIDTEINLLPVKNADGTFEDKDFVLAMDYKIPSGASNGVFMQCFQDTGGGQGFVLSRSESLEFTWGTSKMKPASLDSREMLVIRHIKGDNNLYVYTSNLDGDGCQVIPLNKTTHTVTDKDQYTSLVFGKRKYGQAYLNGCAGEINWCKIWYKDLGESICKKLASWTHEKIKLNVSGFGRYDLYYNPGQITMLSLVANHLLDRTKKWDDSASSANSVGWGKVENNGTVTRCELNEFLNSRFYQAIPMQIQSLMKQMKVKSTAGARSTSINESPCYVTLPSVYDLETSKTSYKGELFDQYDINKTITIMQSVDQRKRAFDGGNYADYWTRSPNLESGGNATSGNQYVWYVKSDGGLGGIETITNKKGVLVEISF